MDRLQALRVFVRVAELGSFVRAAEALGLSRARVSEAVTELERSLGTRLLHRTTRHVSLTDDGRGYYERVREVLADLEEIDASVAPSRAAVRGRVRLALPMALARHFVLPALPRFLGKNPGLELEVRLENRALDLLEQGIDCAVSYGAPGDQGLIARQIATTELTTCAAPSYLTRAGEPRAPEELARHDCIAFLSLVSARPVDWVFEHAGAEQRVRPQGRLAFNTMEACTDAAAHGLGITQVISSLAADAIRRRALRPILRDHMAHGPPIYVVYEPNRQLSPRLRAVVKFLSRVFEPAA